MNRILIVAIASFVAGCQHPVLNRETISTAKAPAAIGPYSQAVRVGNRLYLSGQIGTDSATGQMVAGGIEPQTHQALKNLSAVLESAGFSFDDVVQAQVFLADLDDYATMNAVYKTYFDESFPARAAVQVARLPRDARVEIMMVAVKK
ncbi:MAG: RidA family protein [Phycisphaerae bacterium]|nr:RidA family protein [Phycisphaerae bacterium]